MLKATIAVLMVLAALFVANARRHNGVNRAVYDWNIDRAVWCVCGIFVLSGLSMVIEAIAEAVA